MSDENQLYARVKPYNPKRGYKVQRIHVSCLGRVMEGGDGIIKPIEWIQVRGDQAQVMQTYRQDDRDPDAKEVFDIVTLKQRLAIDRAEEAARMAHMGLGAPKPRAPMGPRIIDARKGDAVMSEGETDVELERRKVLSEMSGHEHVARPSEPSMVSGAEAFINDPAVVGRMAAIDGLPVETAVDKLARMPKPSRDETEAAPSVRRRRKAVPAIGDARSAAGQARRVSEANAFDEGVDMNTATGNEPVRDAEDVEP